MESCNACLAIVKGKGWKVGMPVWGAPIVAVTHGPDGMGAAVVIEREGEPVFVPASALPEPDGQGTFEYLEA